TKNSSPRQCTVMSSVLSLDPSAAQAAIGSKRRCQRMSNISAFRPGFKTALKATTVAGLAAVMLATGIPARVMESHAEAVTVQAPQVASFADVVAAVSPA